MSSIKATYEDISQKFKIYTFTNSDYGLLTDWLSYSLNRKQIPPSEAHSYSDGQENLPAFREFEGLLPYSQETATSSVLIQISPVQNLNPRLISQVVSSL